MKLHISIFFFFKTEHLINYNFVKQTCHFRKHLLKKYSKKITKQLFSLTESRGNVFYMIIVEVEFGKATVVVTKTNDTHTIFCVCQVNIQRS